MDNCLHWLMSLPAWWRIPMLVLSLLAGLVLVGVFTQLVMSGQGADADEPTVRASLWRRLLALPLHYAYLGAVTGLCLTLLVGPFELLLSFTRWSYALCALIGLPAGIALTIAAYTLLDWLVSRRRAAP